MHHLHHVHLSTPLTVYLVLFSSLAIGKPDGARFDILRPLIPRQIAFLRQRLERLGSQPVVFVFSKMQFDHHVKQFEQPFGTHFTNL